MARKDSDHQKKSMSLLFRGKAIFKPLNSFMPTDGTYQLSIFSRQGQMVFRTTDPNAGWDGRLNGKICPAGVYVYKISYFIPGESSPIIKEGTVTLLY